MQPELKATTDCGGRTLRAAKASRPMRTSDVDLALFNGNSIRALGFMLSLFGLPIVDLGDRAPSAPTPNILRPDGHLHPWRLPSMTFSSRPSVRSSGW